MRSTSSSSRLAIFFIFFSLSILIKIDGALVLNKSVVRFNCPQSEGFFPADDLCTGNYIVCVEGVAYPEECPGSTIFDPESLLCVPPNEASCSSNPTTTVTAETTTVTDSTTSSTTLSESTTTAVTDSTSTSTEPTTSTSTTSTTARTTSGTCPDPNNVCKTPDEFVAIPGYCGPDYYICVSCSPYVNTCPGNAIFDPVYLACVPPELATCDQEFRCPTLNGRYPISSVACSSNYYTCINGEAYESKCPGTSIFDPEINTCVALENASCKPIPALWASEQL